MLDGISDQLGRSRRWRFGKGVNTAILKISNLSFDPFVELACDASASTVPCASLLAIEQRQMQLSKAMRPELWASLVRLLEVNMALTAKERELMTKADELVAGAPEDGAV
jgi:hypothetical protein